MFANQSRQHKNQTMELVQSKQNPLLIKVVLETLFEYLQRETLFFCRQVNSIWKQETTFQLQTRGNMLDFKDYDKIVQFTKAFSNSISFPIVNVRLQMPFEISSRSYNMLEKFLQTISPWVVHFELTLKSTSEQFTPNLTKRLNFPKLQRLFIHDLTSHLETSTLSSEPKFNIVRNFFERSPALMQFFYDAPSSSQTTTEYISCLKLSMNSITHLTLMCHLSNATLETLAGIGLKLKEFQMRLGWNSSFSSGTLRKFLETQKNTLEYLQIETSMLFSPTGDPLEFPQMKKLNWLFLQRGGNPDDLLEIGPLNKNNLPNLQRLTLETKSSTNNSKDIFENLQSGVCPSVTILELGYSYLSATTMQRAICLFPNVIKLFVPAKLEIIQLVFSKMPQLEDLEFNFVNGKRDYSDELIDYIVLGRTSSQCEEIRKICKGDWQQMQEYLDKSGAFQKSIRSLKKLKKLAINTIREKVLSELACAELLQMQSLKHICLTKCVLSTELVSTAMMEKMQRQFKLTEY